MALSPQPTAAARTSFTDTTASSPTDSRYNVADAYKGTDSGMRKLDQALTELSRAIDTLRGDTDEMRLNQDHEYAIMESAKTVQQWLLGDLRQPEPTNQYTALIADGPIARKAVDELLSSAGRFARRDQKLLVMPNPLLFKDAPKLDALTKAIDGLRSAAPSLASGQMEHETSSLKSLLTDLNRQSVDGFFAPLTRTVETARDTVTAKPKADGTAPLDSLTHHLALENTIRPGLNQALAVLKDTWSLADIGNQINKVKEPEARQQLARQAVTALMQPDGATDIAQPGMSDKGQIILPGTAQGAAAAAAGVLITTNINAELEAVTSLQKVLTDPHLADNIARFADQHRKLKSDIKALFAKGDTPDGSLTVNITDDGQPRVDLTDHAELKQLVVARDTVARWLEGQPAGDKNAAMIIAASKPADQSELVHSIYGKALGSGYSGSRDWQDPVAQIAMEIEISAKAQSTSNIADFATRGDLGDAQYQGLGQQTVTALEDKQTLTALIERFPDTAAKLDQALAINLRKPDFAAMGITLPKPATPAPTADGPKLIIPGLR